MLERIGLGETATWWILLASAATLVGAFLLVPLVVVRLPADYFVRPRRAASCASGRRLLRLGGTIAKNAIGLALLALGALLLVLPGQGLLTIVLAVTLLDFPGKFRLQRWMATRRGVAASIRWIRAKAGKDPLVLDR